MDACAKRPCHPGVKCHDSPNGIHYRCGACPKGYRGNGHFCQDINDCAGFNPGPCGWGGVRGGCNDTGAGTYTCKCRQHNVFAGGTCRRIQNCTKQETLLCAKKATCNSNGANRTNATCTCGAGFVGDGKICLNQDGCRNRPVICRRASSPAYLLAVQHSQQQRNHTSDGYRVICRPCFPGVKCLDKAPPLTGYKCGKCPLGYTGDGRKCKDADDCKGDPCRVSSKGGGGYKCQDIGAVCA